MPARLTATATPIFQRFTTASTASATAATTITVIDPESWVSMRITLVMPGVITCAVIQPYTAVSMPSMWNRHTAIVNHSAPIRLSAPIICQQCFLTNSESIVPD